MKPRGAQLDTLADMLALLMWQPRTRIELAKLLGVQPDSVRRRVDAFHQAGVIRVIGRREKQYGAGPKPRIYAMQAKPFDQPDTPEVLLP